MADVKEITEKVQNLLQKITDDPEHFEQNLDALDKYLEGIQDVTSNVLDKSILPVYRMIFLIFGAMRRIDENYKKKISEMDKMINNLLDRMGRLEKQWKDWQESR